MPHIPKLVIGGAIKSGTTSVFDYLSGHPEVCASAIKEPHVLLEAQEPAVLLEQYERLFSAGDKPGATVYYEASTGYINHGMTVIQNINSISPDCKLLFILRNPVERLHSFYQFQISRLNLPESLDFTNYIGISAGERTRPADLHEKFFEILKHGRYAKYLSVYYDRWPARNIKVGFFDELVEDPANFMKDVCRFIEVDEGYFNDYLFTASNPTISAKNKGIHRFSHKLNQKVKPFLLRHPGLRKGLFDLYQKLNSSEKQANTLSDENRLFLEGYYRQSNIELEQLLGRKCPGWIHSD